MESTNQFNEGFLQAKQPWLRNAGIASLLIYAFFWLLDIEISRIGESLMVLFFVVMLFANKPKLLLAEPIPYILIAWALFQIGVYQWSAGVFPESVKQHITEARLFTNIFMFVIVAWWLGGNTKRVIALLMLCGMGYIIGITFHEGGMLDSPRKVLTFTRQSFGYIHPEHTSVYSAFVLLTTLTLGKRIISCFPQRFYWLARLFIFITAAISSIAIVVTQTRATWLGLLIVFIITIVSYVSIKFHKFLTRDNSQKRVTYRHKGVMYTTIATISIVTFMSTFNALDIITTRINQEKTVYTQLMEGDLSNIPLTSIGIRLKLWQLGIEYIGKRPIIGWGAGNQKTLIQQSDLPEQIRTVFRHFHNSYLELLVAYGVIGFALYAGLFIYVWLRAWQAWKIGIIPNDIMLFAALWSIYWFIVNLFESYIIFSASGNYLNVIVASILYTYHLRLSWQQPEHHQMNR